RYCADPLPAAGPRLSPATGPLSATGGLYAGEGALPEQDRPDGGADPALRPPGGHAHPYLARQLVRLQTTLEAGAHARLRHHHRVEEQALAVGAGRGGGGWGRVAAAE